MEEKEAEEKKVIIPEITIKDDVVTLETAEIPLVVNKKEVTIKLQQVTAGKRRALTKKYLNTKIQGRELTGSVDVAGFQIGILSSSIIEAPFTASEEILSKFPDSVLDYIYDKYNSIFGKEDEKKNK